MLDQLRKLYEQLTVKQRILALAAGLLVMAGIYYSVQWNKDRGFKPLYSGLSSEDAAAVTAKLRESGVEYRITEPGNTILVPERQIPELRLTMAALGIPKTGRAGFELFDKTNFGQTDFGEQVNFRRALEGELERSIISIAGVESARVHLTFPKDSLFVESRKPAKASVLVKLKARAKLAKESVDAIGNLVASAVEGLDPDHVSVVDSDGKLIAGTKKPEEGSDAAAGDHMISYRLRMEKAVLDKVNATLEPLVGPGKFRAGVAVECDFTSGEQSEENFDPNKSVVATSQKSEDNLGGGSPAGIPGTASNLPRPPARPGPNGGELSRKTENTAYQTSRVVRKIKLPQGTIRRLTVSVLLDQRVRWEVAGGKPKQVLEPPTPAQIAAVKDLVSGVAGIDTNRGDRVVVESIPFDATLSQDPPESLMPKAPSAADAPATGLLAKLPIPKELLIPIAAAAGLILLLGVMFLVWRMKQKKKLKAAAIKVEMAGAPGVTGTVAGGNQLSPAGEDVYEPERDAEQKALDAQAQEILGAIKLPETTTKKGEVLRTKLAEEIKKSPDVMAKVVRTWLQAEGD